LMLDRSPAPHTPEFDRLYADALDIDYAALNRAQDAAIALLRSGEIRVTTPAGTDLRFRTGDRPFNKQNGDGSPERVKSARMRIDRHIELPAGIIRVAPLESSVRGVLVIPALRYGEGVGSVAHDVRLDFAGGKAIKVAARERAVEVEQLLQKSPALASFRELGLGFNPKLAIPPGATTVPYYGYGAGFVRLSLGNNEELAGAVRGSGVTWNFFPDATVTVSDRVLVRNGKLVGP
jgi:leucyl aminopeptidase (aminopeptidase T)